MDQPKNTVDTALERRKISPEDISRYMAEIDTVLKLEANIALRGYEEEPGDHKPWPLEAVRQTCNSIVTFLNQKVLLYSRAEMKDEAEQAKRKCDDMRKLVSELDSAEAVPDGFLQRIKDEVGSSLELNQTNQ